MQRIRTVGLLGAAALIIAGCGEIWIGTFSGDRVGYLPKP